MSAPPGAGPPARSPVDGRPVSAFRVRLGDLECAVSAPHERYVCDTAADVDGYLTHLVRAGLAREESSPVPLPADAARADWPRDPYEPPQLVKFGNLETLILSGE